MPDQPLAVMLPGVGGRSLSSTMFDEPLAVIGGSRSSSPSTMFGQPLAVIGWRQ